MGSGKQIFILEDNEDLRELYGYILEDENYKISIFESISDFKARAVNIPDLYILDILLPDGDGMTLCNELQHTSSTSHVPVIMISAHKDASEVLQQCPNADFIAKPFDINVLTNKIANKIQSKTA